LRATPPSARRAGLALGFVVLALIALVVVPLWVGARTRAILQELSTMVEPARAEVERMVTQFDREVAAVRGYRLSGEAHYLGRYHTAREERLDAAREFQPLAEQLGPPLPALLDEFDRTASAWEASHQRFVLPVGPAEVVSGEMATREAEYDAVISAGERLEAHLRQETADRRQQIQQEERRGLVLSAILALMALVSALVVAGISQRLRTYGRETERLHQESQGLATELGRTVEALRRRTAEAEAEIRERTRAEHALHAEEERFRTEQRAAAAEREWLAAEIEYQRRLLKVVTDNATSALLMMDTDGRGTFWNPAAERMTGYSAEEAMGKTLHELIHHTYPDGTPFPIEECPIDLALPHGVEVEGYEDLFIRKSGEFFPVVCAVKPIVEDGKPAGTVIEVRDVTAEKQAEEALLRAKEEAEAANHAKSEFLATMSHELRTPLNGILGFTDLMEMGIPEPLPETTRSQVKRIDQCARHLLNIIEQILTFSRVEAEQEKVADEIVSLPEVFRSAVEMTAPFAEKKGLCMVTDLEGAPVVIRSDAQKLRQILVNLLGNAVKFTEAGTVTLTVWQENGEVILRVRDTGIGIPPEHLSRVFEPFWQIDQSNTRATGGTGLGLTVSRSLARLLGGDIHAHSVPGKWSTFEVRLPLRAESQPEMTYARGGRRD